MAIDNLDFLNLNSLRSYPVKEVVSRVSTNSGLTIPNDFIVDFVLAASSDISKRYYISALANFDDNITIEIADETDSLVGTFYITTASHTKYAVYRMNPSAAFVGANGAIVVNRLDSLKTLPSGLFLFTLATTEFETRTIVPALKGLSRLIFRNADGSEHILTGDVVVEARTNLKFKLGNTANTVILDAGNNIGLNVVCAEDNCIKTINSIPPDVAGNFTLDFSDCVTLTPIPANTGLIMQDVCCKPCVGCDEIATLTNRLITVEDNLVALRQYYTDLLKLFEDFKLSVTYVCACPPA